MEQSKFYQIKNVTEHEYTLVGCDGSVITRPIRDIDKTATAFTIQDAKDGDVLVASDKSLFIYDGSINENGSVGFYIAFTENMDIILNSDDGCGWEEKDSCYPATKEQRDTLMRAMADAGYEWDTEKKELRKIEDEFEKQYEKKSKENTKLYDSMDDLIADALIEEMEGSELDDRGKYNRIYWIKSHRQKPAWSEEDMSKVQRICKYLNEAKKYYADIAEVRECIEWLKSLKP